MGDLTKNFSRSEVACKGKDCCEHTAAIDYRIMQVAQKVRDFMGERIDIPSGFRCRRHNATLLNSSPTSFHCVGQALDLRIPKGYGKKKKMLDFIRSLPEVTGIGIGRTYIHVDNGHETRTEWQY